MAICYDLNPGARWFRKDRAEQHEVAQRPAASQEAASDGAELLGMATLREGRGAAPARQAEVCAKIESGQ